MKEIKLQKTLVKKVSKKLLESLSNYRKLTLLMGADVPIGSLCLDKKIEKILLDNGLSRVYDILNMDLTKIKGLGRVRIGYITSRLNEFFPVG